MSPTKIYHRPYPEPEPRSFVQWCTELGVDCIGSCPEASKVLSYDEFFFLPDVRLLKVRESELYGWWRKHGDVWGECRTAKEWLEDFNWELVDPTEEELNNLNVIMEHDQFWQWSSGIVTEKPKPKVGLLALLKRLIVRS